MLSLMRVALTKPAPAITPPMPKAPTAGPQAGVSLPQTSVEPSHIDVQVAIANDDDEWPLTKLFMPSRSYSAETRLLPSKPLQSKADGASMAPPQAAET